MFLILSQYWYMKRTKKYVSFLPLLKTNIPCEEYCLTGPVTINLTALTSISRAPHFPGTVLGAEATAGNKTD